MVERKLLRQSKQVLIIEHLSASQKDHFEAKLVINAISEILENVEGVNLVDIETLMRKKEISGYLIARPFEVSGASKNPKEIDSTPYSLGVVYTYTDLRSELKKLGVDYTQNLERLERTIVIKED